MADIFFEDLLKLLALIFLASISGWTLSRLLPWSSHARSIGVPGAFGLGLAPLILGIKSILVLEFFPGKSHSIHLTIVFISLILIIFMSVIFQRKANQYKQTKLPKPLGFYIVFSLIILCALMLIINAIFIPLLQNDSLEYALVGRLLYESRDLSSYPAIHPEQSSTGFFGPWTHPPMYVSMIYLMNVLQENAYTPGLMRLISPWFILCSTWLIYVLGSHISRMTGIFSALLFLSTPLIFFSGDSGLIDGLPILGLTLITTTILFIEKSSLVRGAIIGLVTGIALWTHSQAILFLLMAVGVISLFNGTRNFRLTLQELISFFIIVCLVGSWPYLKNLQIFGSVVSDNPAVFALPSLDWPGYFSVARGLDNWTAILQYGLLKGWFAFEAYGISFWLMTIGLLITIKNNFWRNCRMMIRLGGREADSSQQILLTSLAIILAYLGGVLISILIDLDIMIKNERYMLIILPFVAILAGYSLEFIIIYLHKIIKTDTINTFKKDFALIILGFLFMIFLVQIIVQAGIYRWKPFIDSISYNNTICSENHNLICANKGKPIESIFHKLPRTLIAMFWIRENLKHDDLVLSFRPSNMFYSRQMMISYLDERLLPLYEESSPQQAFKFLLDLGVTHIHVPNYSLPVLYNSVMEDIISNPAFTDLLFTNAGTQILQLRRTVDLSLSEASFPEIDFSPSHFSWSKFTSINIFGRKNFFYFPSILEEYDPPKDNEIFLRKRFFQGFHRNFSTSFVTKNSNINDDRSPGLLPITGKEYRVGFDFSGKALVKIWMNQFNAFGESVNPQKSEVRISEFVLNERSKNKHFSRRFFAFPGAAYVEFRIEHVGHSNLKVNKAKLELIDKTTVEDL